ncbi:MAG: phosphoglycolate phosphatase [Roseovarius sp.]
MRTVVFDLDGTLADTSGDLIAAANCCFRAIGAGDLLDPVADAATALRGGRAMLALGFARLGHGDAAAEIDRQYPRLLEAYAAAIDRHTVLYPGAMAAVAALAEGGCRVAICTNKPERLARLLLARLGVLDAFGAVVGADTLPVRKPDPAPLREAVRRAGGLPPGAGGRALLVGDSVTDRDTSRAAGVPSVLVAFGPAGAEVAALAPDAVIADFAELPEVVERLLGPA